MLAKNFARPTMWLARDFLYQQACWHAVCLTVSQAAQLTGRLLYLANQAADRENQSANKIASLNQAGCSLLILQEPTDSLAERIARPTKWIADIASPPIEFALLSPTEPTNIVG